MQLNRLDAARKTVDKLRVGRGQHDWSLSDAHECLDGAPEATIFAEDNVNLSAKQFRVLDKIFYQRKHFI
jgi:hypothetical protein